MDPVVPLIALLKNQLAAAARYFRGGVQIPAKGRSCLAFYEIIYNEALEQSIERHLASY